MARLRESVAAFLSLTLVATPVWSGPNTAFGTVLLVQRAHVGRGSASAGATVFDGDKLSTERAGSLQIQGGAARLMLGESSSATIGELEGTRSATLLSGTAIFSTARASDFALRAATAVIRPQTDGPTIAQVWFVDSKQLMVRSTRGALTITVKGETQIIPEAIAYRVVLDPEAMPEIEVPRGAGTRGYVEPSRKPSRTHFYIVAIIVVSVPTYFAVDEVFESPDKP
jgi:hypothetical protein